MSIADSRKFPGLKFGMTISASDLPGDGMSVSEDDVNRLTFQEAGHFLREGGRIVLGHRWKLGGVTRHR